MEQRDLIKEEAERLGRALGKVIARFFVLREEDTAEEARAITDRELIATLDLDPEELIPLSAPELETYLLDRRLSGPSLEPLAAYAYELGLYAAASGDRVRAGHCFATALRLLDLGEQDSDALTFGAMTLRTQVSRALKREG